MSEGKIPHNALIVVADGTGARFFRNSGQENKVSLSADGEFKPTNLLNAGPAGKRPRESSGQETDEATFAKQLANELYRRAQSGSFAALVLIADPQTLGQIRPSLHKEVQDRLVTMRAFIFACLIALVIAIAAAVALDGIVQEPSSEGRSTRATQSTG